MNIFFRTDASLQIGIGHMMRCLTLAGELERRGSDISFICREENGSLIELIKEKKFRVCSLSVDTDTVSEKESIQKILRNQPKPPDWLIIDHYEIDSKWESSIRNLVRKIMVIDDLVDRKHDCDLLLNQNYNNTPDLYKRLLPEKCVQLLGPEYALLRPQFSKARENVRQHTREVKRILVFLGGADKDNHTSRILRAIKALNVDNIDVDVVIGVSNPHRNEIEKLASGMLNTECYYNVNNMAEMMVVSDLAIGAGGTSIWERCCLALPSMVMSVAENQTEISWQLSNDGYILYLGNSDVVAEQDIANDLNFMLRHPEIVRRFSLKAKKLTDGKGAKRVCDYLFNITKPVHLRYAGSEDCKRVYEWRNHPETREYCFDSSPLVWENHKNWFSEALSSSQTELLIGESSSGPAGVVRYDLSNNKAVVSIHVSHEFKNQGIGSIMLELGNSWITKNYPEVEQITADIIVKNIPSIKAFTRAGFEKDYLAYKFDCRNRSND
ncbi:MAG: UDP-2,4-diacetamido-2,4,6-trideoxy-beta-L-altropyranose hydrolase [Candidatus Brocadiaceae bacterium]|nr:UDP-2,4-diacetamido-2,4,6-trideoxy-beta-L-altropyranose hydrolase [Candidatus Brocadiaceae bacterium]